MPATTNIPLGGTRSKPEGPYSRYATEILETRIGVPLPLLVRSKRIAVSGYTGRTESSHYATVKEVIDWTHSHGDGNIGLHLAKDVLVIDVDHHDDKAGADTIAKLEVKLGPLPPTWETSARPEEERHGQKFYRLPEGYAGEEFGGKAGPGVDILYWGYRYSMTVGSVHPDTGETVGCWDPEGNEVDMLPHVDDLPELPESWCEYLLAANSHLHREDSRAGRKSRRGRTKGAGDQEATRAIKVDADGDGSPEGLAFLARQKRFWLADRHEDDWNNAAFEKSCRVFEVCAVPGQLDPDYAYNDLLIFFKRSCDPGQEFEASSLEATLASARDTGMTNPVTLDAKARRGGSTFDAALVDVHDARVWFQREYGEDFRTVRTDRLTSTGKESHVWYQWTGQYWSKEGARAAIRTLFYDLGGQVLAEGQAIDVPDRVVVVGDEPEWDEADRRAQEVRRTYLLVNARKFQSQTFVDSVVYDVASLLAVTEDFFASNRKGWLNTPSGMWSTRTDEVRPHDREFGFTWMTKIAPVEGETPGLDAYLKEAFDTDEQRQALLQRLAYSITNEENFLKMITNLFGPAGVGKSMLTTVLLQDSILGTGAMGGATTAASYSVLSSGKDDSRFNEALLAAQGKNLIVVPDYPQGLYVRDGVAKALTGGDFVATAVKNSNEQAELMLHAKMILVGNYPLKINVDDDGLVTRLDVVPFRHTTGNYRDEFRVEAGAILHKLIGLAREIWQTRTVVHPREWLETKEEVLRDLDPVAQFVEAEVIEDPDGFVPSSELYSAYLRWNELDNGRSHTAAALKRATVSQRVAKHTGARNGNSRVGSGRASKQVRGLHGIRLEASTPHETPGY